MNKKAKHLKIMSQEAMTLFENYENEGLSKDERAFLDLFLLSFYTGGLSLRSLAYLKWKDINENKLNCSSFEYPLIDSIPLNQQAQNIIEKYKDQSYKDYVLPIFTFKHDTSAQKESQIKLLAKNINLTLRKISDWLNIEGGYPTLRTAKYTFIAKLSREKMHPMAIYTFAGATALYVESYLLEQETQSEKEVRMKETLKKINETFS